MKGKSHRRHIHYAGEVGVPAADRRRRLLVVVGVAAPLHKVFSVGAFAATPGLQDRAANAADDSSALQASINAPQPQFVADSNRIYSISRPLKLPAGKTIVGLNLVAIAPMTHMVELDSSCKVLKCTLDAGNRLNGSDITRFANNCVYITGKQNCEIRGNTLLNWYRYGVFVENSPTSAVSAVVIAENRCVGLKYEEHKLSRSGAYAIHVAHRVRPPETKIDHFDYDLSQAITDITISSNYCEWGQYGIAIYTSRNVVVQDNTCAGFSRGISVQTAAVGVKVLRNRLINTVSTGVHLAYGIRESVVSANHVSATMTNDNVGIQSYYGCEGITISDNTLESNFEHRSATRKDWLPGSGIRIGQRVKNITLANNRITGFRCGINIRSTIYETRITRNDPNYLKAGCKNVRASNNSITASPSLEAVASSDSCGLLLFKSEWWPVEAKEPVEDVVVEGNEVIGYESAYIVRSSGEANPAAIAKVELRANKAMQAGKPLTLIGITPSDEVCEAANSWPPQGHSCPA